jgi:hypothetical protein
MDVPRDNPFRPSRTASLQKPGESSHPGSSYHSDMRLADTIRREASTTGVDHGRYACRTYGIPLERDLDRCPECGHATIAPIEDVIDPTFSDRRPPGSKGVNARPSAGCRGSHCDRPVRHHQAGTVRLSANTTEGGRPVSDLAVSSGTNAVAPHRLHSSTPIGYRRPSFAHFMIYGFPQSSH